MTKPKSLKILNPVEYTLWKTLRDRCRNEKSLNYNMFGAKGVTLSDDWHDCFFKFFEDVGNRPSKEHCFIQKDKKLGYCKDNCMWSKTRNV